MEAGIWVYPWDLLDEGPRPVLTKLARLGYTAVHLAAAYHPIQAVLPHNPRRRTILEDRAAVYYTTGDELWRDAVLRPVRSAVLTEAGDALHAASEFCRDLGLQLVAWTVCLDNTDLALRHPSTNVVNVFGEPYRNLLCPAHPEVGNYLSRLVLDLKDRCDSIELESPHWLPFPHQHHAKVGVPVPATATLLLNLCFCVHCETAGRAGGVDMDALRSRLGAHLRRFLVSHRRENGNDDIEALIDMEPSLRVFMAVRELIVERLIARLASESAPTPIFLLSSGNDDLTGAVRANLANLVTRLEVPIQGSAAQVASEVQELELEHVPFDRLTVGLSILEPGMRDMTDFESACTTLAEKGITRVAIYNYGLADSRRVEWVSAALNA